MGEKVLEKAFEQVGRDEIQGTDVGSSLQIREHSSSLDKTVIKSYGKNAVGGRSSDTRSQTFKFGGRVTHMLMMTPTKCRGGVWVT